MQIVGEMLAILSQYIFMGGGIPHQIYMDYS